MLFLIIALAITAEIVFRRAAPILKGRVIETLSTRFNSKVELDQLNASVFHGLQLSGSGLRIFPTADVVAAGATHPLIMVAHFSFHAGLFALFIKPMHVSTVHVEGVEINIPPREMRQQRPKQQASTRQQQNGKLKIYVDQIICDQSTLILGTAKPGKDPKRFELKHIVMRDVGSSASWSYDATLTNAIPKGKIHAVGAFGPWNIESPGDSLVSGKYTFDHADLNTIKGIGGILSSVGEFKGQLNKIDVQGTTDTPDFSLDTANHPMPLHTSFHAIVDGTSGDTYLDPVQAKLGQSDFTCRGAVVNVKGKGHIIDLNVDVPAGRMEDFLQLTVKSRPPLMTGVIGTKAKLHIRPGKESISNKLNIDGAFTLRTIHFTNPKVQDDVDMFSMRAQGRAKDAKPGAADVNSQLIGQFSMADGKLAFGNLAYTLPGATMQLSGIYSLDGKIDFTGKVRTQATLSQMVASPWKSFALQLFVDRFFKKNGAGTEIPVKITGTRSSPKFDLDFHSHDHQNKKDN